MKRSAGLLVIAMMVGALGVTGCKSSSDEAAMDDGSASAADAPESPAGEPGSAMADPGSDGQGTIPAVAVGDVEPVLEEGASLIGRTAARMRGAYERWERRHARMRERRHDRWERRERQERREERRERRGHGGHGRWREGGPPERG